MALAMLLAGCKQQVADLDEVYYPWDQRRVVCAVGLDTISDNGVASIEAGMDRALAEESVLLLFTHTPGRTVTVEKLEAVISYAAEIGLPFVTFDELVAGGPRRAGVSISFDDAAVGAWYDTRELLARYGARVTLFVTRYDQFRDDGREQLRELYALGHDVQAHAVRHRRGPEYVEEHGLRAYLDDDVIPSIEWLRADGYDPVAFAYPFGARTAETDAAILEHVELLRSVTFSTGVPLISDPCPE